MKIKTIFFTFLLCIGISFQYCTYDDDCHCGDVKKYFDVTGFQLWHIDEKDYTVPEQDTIQFSAYGGLQMYCESTYLSGTYRSSWGLHMGNAAQACSCVDAGYAGSKNEKLENITVLTLNDFDDQHRANDTINDLLQIDNQRGIVLPLKEYLEQNNTLMKSNKMRLIFQKSPELDKALKVRVTIKLSTGEVYTSDSPSIYIQN